MNEDIIQALQEEKSILESKITYLPEGDPYIVTLQSYITKIDADILALGS